MAVNVRQAKGKSKAELDAEELERINRLDAIGLHPTDKIRFPRIPSKPTSTAIEAKPHDVNPDGSVLCFVAGAARSIRPERIEVVRLGPRGGEHWAPLTQEGP